VFETNTATEQDIGGYMGETEDARNTHKIFREREPGADVCPGGVE